MFQPWRIKLRQADEALKGGRLDEAASLLADPQLREFQPAQSLTTRLATEMARRGQQRFSRGETPAAWRDLTTAEQLGGAGSLADTLRHDLSRHLQHEAEGYLGAGNPQAALERLNELLPCAGQDRDVLVLKQIAQKVETARKEARRGRFHEAETQVSEALALRPELTSLNELRQQYHGRSEQSRQFAQRLHEALAAQQWTAALGAADAMLEIAPECTLARDARHRAWAAVGTQLQESYTPPRARPPVALLVDAHETATVHDTQVAVSAPPQAPPGPRFLLWVDGVGGYLVCQGDRVTLGRPDPDSHVDIPILGDLSHHHAAIRRDGEGYVLEPLRSVRINGRSVTTATSLPDAALIELGSSVRLKFRRPHAWSATAVLEFASTHRTQPAADAIVLMAESCVLGPGRRNHIECRTWPGDVVIYRQGSELGCQGSELGCRAAGSFAIDQQTQQDRGLLTRSSSVVGEAFSLKLEEV